MKLGFKILLILAMGIPLASYAQLKPRLAGLGGNVEYMQLLEQEQRLSAKEDSLLQVISEVRNDFRNNPAERDKYAGEILRLENEIFDIKNQGGIVAGKLSEIEEQFILQSMQAGQQVNSEPANTAGHTGEHNANLVYNSIFRDKLTKEDYEVLLKAQSMERRAADQLLEYYKAYDNMLAVGPEYERAETAEAADSIYVHYQEMRDICDDAADSLANVWSYIFDNKVFAYNYILETQNQLRLLVRFESEGRDARDEIVRQRASSASEEVVGYLVQKDLVLKYETTLAELFDLPSAADSLKKAGGVFDLLKRPVPDVVYEERSFIEYEDISVSATAKYTSANPIPELKEHRRGLVYRVLVGTYTQRQAVSVFKGLYPLEYLKQEDGRWAYYAGSYRDVDQAETGLDAVKKRGFRTAVICMWNNGEMTILRAEPAKNAAGATITYRVEISGAKDGLSADVRRAINDEHDGVDITISGTMFVAGPFSTPLDAERVASVVRKTDPSLSIRIQANNP